MCLQPKMIPENSNKIAEVWHSANPTPRTYTRNRPCKTGGFLLSCGIVREMLSESSGGVSSSRASSSKKTWSPPSHLLSANLLFIGNIFEKPD